MRTRHLALGFSLIELMVAMAIGLVTALVIMQVFAFFEGQKRTTTTGANAQSNGAIALYTISRDLQMAGYGLLPVADSALECDPVPSVDHDSNAATPLVNITPVVVVDGGAGAGASDTVSIRYGTSNLAGVPSVISTVVGTTATVDNNLGCQVNDVALLVNGLACSMTRVTALSVPPVYTGVTLQSAAGAAGGVSIACLGQWQEFAYDVVGGNLRRNGEPIIPNIVSLQAQYGISASSNSNRVIQWVDAALDAGSGINWAAPSVTNRNRIKSVRIAVVARSGIREKEVVSSACSSTTTIGPSGVCAWDATSAMPYPLASPYVASPAPTLDLSNTADWEYYRYRVFETIIPIRNAIWAKETL